MGIFFHRRAERSNCVSEQGCNTEQSSCVQEDPRRQYSDLKSQKADVNANLPNLPGRDEIPAAAPPADEPSKKQLDMTPRPRDLYQYSNTDKPSVRKSDPPRTNDEHVPPSPRPNLLNLPPLTLTESLPPVPMPDRRPIDLQAKPRDLYQYSNDSQVPAGPINREVPPPPIPGLFNREVPPPTRDLYQYNDRQVPLPLPGLVNREVPPPLPGLGVRDVPPLPGPLHREFENDHPGPGSRHRRTLREQLNLPERHNPYNQNPVDTRPDRRPEPSDRPAPPIPPKVRETTNRPLEARSNDGKVVELNPQDFDRLVRNSDRPVILDVYGIGCGPCNQLAPVLDGVADRYRGQATVYRMNAANLGRNPELAAQLGVHSVPAVFMFNQGRQVSNDVGFHQAGFYTSKLDGLVAQSRQNENNENRYVPSFPSQNPHRVREERESISPDDGRPRNLGPRLERIKDDLARLTHLSAQEKEQAFHPSSDEQITMKLINNERRKHGLPDVVQDPRLQIIASRHTDYQISHGMTHNENTPGWQNVAQRMKQVGLQGWRENAASGSFTPVSLVQMWMNSPGHRAAILGEGNIAAVSIRGGKATFNLTTDPELGRARS